MMIVFRFWRFWEKCRKGLRLRQVPGVTQITGNAFDPETGTLKRGVLPSVINKLDTDALAFASKMRQASPGKIVCLTMGPPMAKDILIYSLTRCADSSVLLTDRALVSIFAF